MSILKNDLYVKDVLRGLQNLKIEEIKGKSILVTGASGLIGSCIVDMLIMCNQFHEANMLIYVAGRNDSALMDRFDIKNQENIIPVRYDATKQIDFNFHADYIIHCASNATPDKYVNEPVDTMMSNFYGMYNILQYANKVKSKKVIYISSSEVYGKIVSGEPLIETGYGPSDVLDVRSSYVSSKRATETLCVGFAKQYGVNISIVRPGHVYGPTAGPNDMRVATDFLRKAAQGRDIELKSQGTQLRSYCYCVDCASAILWVMLKGETCQAYNISNRNSIITIRQMAEIVAKYGNVKLNSIVASETDKRQFNPMDNSSLNSEKIELLGWQGIFDAEVGLQHTIEIMNQQLGR